MGQLKTLIKNKFGYDVTDLTAYTDEQQQELVTKQVTEARTLELINIATGIKGTQDIHLFDDSVIYQDASDCGTMTPEGDSVFGKMPITVKEIGYEKAFCNKQLRGFWTQLGLRPGTMAEDEQLPFEQAITNYILQLHSLELDKLVWKGDTDLSTGNLQFINGFKTIFDASSDVIEANVNGVTGITTSNAYDVFYQTFLKASDDMGGVAEDPMFTIFTDRGNFNKLVKNMVDKNYYHYNPDNLKSPNSIELVGTGITVEVAPGLVGTGGIYGGKRSALTFGTDLSSDTSQFKLWYSEDDDKLKMRSKFSAGVATPYYNEIVKFTLDGSASSPSL
jgi:hypothetical protein